MCTNQNTVVYPQDPLDRFFFKDSSYWIYKDSVSNLIDSVCVSKSGLFNENTEKMNPLSAGKCFQLGYVKMHSKFLGDFEYILNISPSDFGTRAEDEVYTIKIDIPNSLLYYNFYLFKNSQYINEGLEYGLIDTVTKLNVEGIEYSDLLHKSNPFGINPDFYKESWAARHIGIVKFIKHDGSVWELIRYNIKQ